MPRFTFPSEASTGLPLVRLRLFCLVLNLIFFIVAGSLCLKIFTNHDDEQDLINSNLPSGVTVHFGYNDVKTATIVLFISTHLATAILSKSIIVLLNDIFHVIPPRIARFLRISGKEVSSTTLPYQALAFALLIVFNGIAMGFMSFLTFTRDATFALDVADNVRVDPDFLPQLLSRLGISVAYSGMQHIRIAAELPWVSVTLLMPTTLVTFAAYRKRKMAVSASRSAVSSESVLGSDVEKSIDEKKEETSIIIVPVASV
ncbi:hypothetical protein HGRIS_014304 [Hohenbuehelia grisea]|uniref:Uncharacterized protein n=1 Tax=Hohenbuehelia grisea TaxID=104357 RepID=A0ABR3JTM3_9AGAR